MKKNKKKFPPVLRLILLVICGAVLGVNVYLANAKSLVGNQMPMPFGYGASVVLSGSMEPEFSKGDLIIVGEADSYQERDIVVFQDGASLVVHRIIEIDGEKIITQGDANNVPDEPIESSVIKGKVVFHKNKLEKGTENKILLESPEKLVYSCLDLTPKTVTCLQEETGLPVGRLLMSLQHLQAAHMAEEVWKNYYVRKP